MLFGNAHDPYRVECRSTPAGATAPERHPSAPALAIGRNDDPLARNFTLRVLESEGGREQIQVHVSTTVGGIEPICLSDGSRLIVATDEFVCDIDVANSRVSWRYSAFSCVSDAWILRDGDVLIVHELGAVRLSKDGRDVWEHGCTGLVTRSRREGGTLVLECDDSAIVRLDEQTGNVTPSA